MDHEGDHMARVPSIEEMIEMDEVKIKLAAFWVAAMLIYLLGDVLRMFSGDMKPGEIDGVPATQGMWLGIAVIMLTPIVMVVLSVMLNYPVNRWVNITVTIVWVLFNITGLPYASAFDNFLIAVSFVVNALTLWTAWNWV